MTDRDTVVSRIETICAVCKTNKWQTVFDSDTIYPLLKDALALLKEQEAVEPQTQPSAKGYWYTCGACGWWLFEVRDTVHFDDRKRTRYCASCGKAVKWE